jgi:GTP-binding protein HflX
VLIFENDLSPAQIRNIEQEIVECKVLDRSELILDIFASRARTHEARLQVELAQLEYTYPRLTAMWSHLERIVGGAPAGIGTRGPGEQQLEIDRRIVQRRKSELKRDIERIQGRKQREVEKRNADFYTVGLVGYTNAGKSTLFNTLTDAKVYADDKLFATLDTRTRKWDLGGGDTVMLSDTVGFVRNLPHHLVASFRATLEESVQSDLLLVVMDISDPNAEMQLQTVQATLDEIGADHGKRLIALNKMDALPHAADQLVWLNRHPEAIPISAKTGLGIEEIQAIVLDQMLGGVMEVTISLPTRDGRSIDYLEKRTEVLDRTYLEGRLEARVRIGRRHVESLLARGGEFTIDGLPPREALDTIWPSEPVLVTTRIPPHVRFTMVIDRRGRGDCA